MENKNKLIAEYQNRQTVLKNEINGIKKKLPTLIIGFAFFTFVSLYFLEDKFYKFFGNGVNYIISGVIFIGIVCLFFVYHSFNSIRKKEKEKDTLSSKLYNLMKLDEATNE